MTKFFDFEAGFTLVMMVISVAVTCLYLAYGLESIYPINYLFGFSLGFYLFILFVWLMELKK